jgi:transcriptional regulator with XRE-family HTH domain
LAYYAINIRDDRVGGRLKQSKIELAFRINLTAAHCRAARGWLGWTQAELSKQSGVGLSTIKDFEGGKRQTHKGVQLLLQNAFAQANIWCSEGGIYEGGYEPYGERDDVIEVHEHDIDNTDNTEPTE